MLHQSMEITRLLIIALPYAFLAFAGFDLLLRIANAFNVRTTLTTQTLQEVEVEPMSALEQSSVKIETVEPTTYYEQPATSPEQSSPAPKQSEPKQQPTTETSLSQLKRYKLHGHDVVPVAQLSINIPATVKRYKLRGEAVVRLCDIA